MNSGLFKSSGRDIRPLLFLFLLLLIFQGPASARQFTHDSGLTTSPQYLRNTESPSHLHIIAVMVEFQPDSNRFTSGNGTFDDGSIPFLESPGTNIDALPHDQGYFEAHLEFTKNYFQRVSNGRLKIDYQVLPKIYRLNQKMEEYSPTGLNPELTPLARLVQDTWDMVSSDPDPDIQIEPGQNFAFIIFHAGIGRDVELTGSSLDRTPQDIPSVYLSTASLRNLLNDPSFSGFEVDNGNLLIDHSIILPRTLSRSGEDISGNRFVLPLSINGMLTAQIGRRIGLPYLFHTETGESGIGRFGLMDGAGIFSYHGLFPPEPSAWEKIYMGWTEPLQIPYDHTETIHLQASMINRDGDVAKVSLSQSEYFLLENRHRDPMGNGIELTIRKPDGTITTQFFTNDDIDFVRQNSGFDDLLEPGVIIDVSHFDFSLPGGRTTLSTDGQQLEKNLNGGILIWHIDENVIRNGIFANNINNNPVHRGVDLKEADGAQDIGRPVSTGFFQNEVNGSPFDFWWSGNNSSVIFRNDTLSLYQNKFGPQTTPDNRSHTGAVSHFELFDFSDNRPLASFRIRKVEPFESLYTLVRNETLSDLIPYNLTYDNFQKRYPLAMIPFENDSGTDILIPGQNGILSIDLKADSNTTDYQFLELDKPQQPLLLSDSGTSSIALAELPFAASDLLELHIVHYLNREFHTTKQFQLEPNFGFISMSEPGIIDLDGSTQRLNLNTNTIITDVYPVQRSETLNGVSSRIENNRLIIQNPDGTKSHLLNTELETHQRLHTGLIQSENSGVYVYLLGDGKLTLYTPEDQYQIPVQLSDSEFIEWPAFADINQNGDPEILFIDQETGLLNSKNTRGALSPGFPVSPPPGHIFTGTPLIADINGNGSSELIIQAHNKRTLSLFAYDMNGNPAEGFPLLIGGLGNPDAMPVHPLLFDRYLIAVSPDGDLKSWFFPEMENIKWASGYGSNFNNKVSGMIDFQHQQEPAFTLLNTDETYNWPNPAKNETHIRFETVHPAQITIKITTLSGRLIYDQTIQARGTIPEEVLLDTSGWPSGAYIALIEANDGIKKEKKLIKIAIVK